MYILVLLRLDSTLYKDSRNERFDGTPGCTLVPGYSVHLAVLPCARTGSGSNWIELLRNLSQTGEIVPKRYGK